MSDLKKPISLTASYNTSAPVGPSDGIWVTLPDVSGLESLPASGTITFRYTRKKLILNEGNSLTADLCLCELLAVEGDESPAEEKNEDVVDKLFAAAKQEPEEMEEGDEGKE